MDGKKMYDDEWQEKILNCKRKIVMVAQRCRSGHIPSSLSCLEILYTLYDRVCDIKTDNTFNGDKQDSVVLSKEHGKIAQLCVLVELGLIPDEILYEWMQDGGRVGHDIFRGILSKETDPIDCSFSSLGHGLGVGIGLAIANPKGTVYVICGDGELQEGSCWESLMYIGHNKLNNLITIIDRNSVQIDDYTRNIVDSSSNLYSEISSFGFSVSECNGHDCCEIFNAIDKRETNKPFCLLANTIKGKEVEFLLFFLNSVL